MSFLRSDNAAQSLRKALLFSLTAHLLVLMAGGAQINPVINESGVADRQLQALKVSVSRSANPAVDPRPISQARQQALPRIVERVALPAEVGTTLAQPVSLVADAAPTGAVPFVSPPTASPVPVDSPVVVATAAGSGRDMVLPDGYWDAVRGYRIALASRAKRFRLYPPAARENGIGGRPEIEIIVPVAGPLEFRVRQSSGHEILDRAALEMLRRSADHVELPAQLKGFRLTLTLPVEFSLSP